MSEIDQLIKYQAEMVKREKRKKDELNIIKDTIEDDSLPDIKIKNIADGYYEIFIYVEEVSKELIDILELSIVSDTKYHNRKGERLVMKGTLDFSPMSVATTLMTER